MRRRSVLRSALAGGALLCGCVSTSTETEPDPTPEPEVETAGAGDRPSYAGVVELAPGQPYWALELPRVEEEDALYRYRVENLAPAAGRFDVLFLSEGNYASYVERDSPTWFTPLTATGVETAVTKSSTVNPLGYGELFSESYYLVVDNTDYASVEASTTAGLRARVEADVYRDGIGPVSDVGEVAVGYLERAETSPTQSERRWTLEVRLADGVRSGALKAYPGATVTGDPTDLVLRRSLDGTSGVERFDYRDGHRLRFPATEYVLVVEVDDEVVARSVFEQERSLSAGEPAFESHVSPFRVGDDVRARTLPTGKTSFSVDVANDGAVPVWVTDVLLTEGVERPGFDGGYWTTTRTGEYDRFDVGWAVPPGETRRFGARGYSVPALEDVDDVCDGHRRTARMEVRTLSGYVLLYDVVYSLDEPARQVDVFDGEHYVCESGTIHESAPVFAGYADETTLT